MKSLIRGCLYLALCFSFLVSSSQLYGQVVYSISGFVEDGGFASGPLAGQTYIAEFEIDTSVPDTDPSPDRGLYPNAIVSATVEFESGFTSEVDFTGGVVTVQRDLAGGGVFLQDESMMSTFLVYDLNNPFDTDALPTDPALQFSASPDSLVFLMEPMFGSIISFSNVDLGPEADAGPIVFAVISSSEPEPVVLGDCNLDGEVTFEDIDPMIENLVNGNYLDQADCNEDGEVNFSDIGPFVGFLMAG